MQYSCYLSSTILNGSFLHNIGDSEHIISPLCADLKESVHRSHALSDHFFLRTNPSKRSITGLQVSDVEISLNEANLINDFHLITSFCDIWK